LSTKHEDTYIYRKTTLDNGLRIITEEIPYFQSVSLGIWVRSGSRFERRNLNGICHFIEHMLFKGTERRSARAIAREIDSVGGGLNAFTGKELTSFYSKVLHENLELAVDLLTDIFLHSSFPEDEIEREKRVVVQEIRQLEDSPEDLVHEILAKCFWGGDPLGQPILGTVPNITALDRDTLTAFKERNYTAEDTIICAAGRLSHESFLEMTAPRLGSLPAARETADRPVFPGSNSSSRVVERDLEQVHVCLGAAGPSAVDEERHAAYVLNTIFGSGMSSRLFQEVREKNALAYSVYSFISSFSDTGLFGVYAGCDPNRLEELLTILKNESAALPASITEEDMRTAKQQIRGNILLAMESSDARMNRLAKGELFFGRFISTEEIIDSVEKVRFEEVRELAERMISEGSFSTVLLGPLNERKEILGTL
jgi:predicted Zn-dependent peptidase